MNRYALALSIALPTLLMPALDAPALALDDVEPFPDEWFFGGAERPLELRDLEGKKAIEIKVDEWRGDETSLADSKGKVVVIDFWATWCGPCMAAIPKNVEMVEKYEKQGLVFIGLHDAAGGWDRVDAVIADNSINYPVAKDANAESQKAYKLKFWPTYVVIDRNGIIRGAGLVPGQVEEAVKILLDEPYEGKAQEEPGVASFPDEWFLGAEHRPMRQRKAEGRPLASLEAEAWSAEPLTKEAWSRRVMVVQFVNPGFGYSLTQLDALAPLAEKYSRQGVVFLGVCDTRADWDRMQAIARDREVGIPIAWDAPLPAEEGEPAMGLGRISEAFGVRYGAPLGVVDRAGVIRAVGLKPDHLETVLNTLLAEPMPAPAEAAPEGD